MKPEFNDTQREAIAVLSESPRYRNESKIHIFMKLPWKDKPAYFKTHFLMPVCAVIVILALAIFVTVKVIVPTKEPALYVAVVNQALPIGNDSTLQTQYSDVLHEPVTVDNYVDTNKDGLSKLQTLIANKQVDVIIAPEDTFTQLAGYGYMEPLSKALTATQERDFSAYAVKAAGFSDSDEYDSYDASGVGKAERLPYGVGLAKAAQWESLEGENAVAGIVANTQHKAAAQQFLNYLFRVQS